MGAELPQNSFSVAKKGKVFEQKKLLQPLLGTPEGTKMVCTVFFVQVPSPLPVWEKFPLYPPFLNQIETCLLQSPLPGRQCLLNLPFQIYATFLRRSWYLQGSRDIGFPFGRAGIKGFAWFGKKASCSR